MHQRAQRLIGRGEQACRRLRERCTGHRSLTWVGGDALSQPDRPAGERPTALVGGGDREPRAVDDPARQAQDVRLGRRGEFAKGGGRLAREVEQARGHRHAADAVGDGVVQLHDDRRALTVPPLDQGHLPQRTVAVEVLLGHLLGDAHQRPVGPVAGDVEPLEVEGEVEVRVDLPARRDRGDRVADDPLAQLGDRQGHPGDPFDQQLDLRVAVEHGHGDDHRAQDRVPLHAPHHRVEGAHPVEPVVGHPTLLTRSGSCAEAIRRNATTRGRRDPGGVGAVIVGLRGSVGRPQGDVLPSPPVQPARMPGPGGTSPGPGILWS